MLSWIYYVLDIKLLYQLSRMKRINSFKMYRCLLSFWGYTSYTSCVDRGIARYMSILKLSYVSVLDAFILTFIILHFHSYSIFFSIKLKKIIIKTHKNNIKNVELIFFFFEIREIFIFRSKQILIFKYFWVNLYIYIYIYINWGYTSYTSWYIYIYISDSANRAPSFSLQL